VKGIVLYRIDERLIHGQVVIGWGSQLRPGRYVVVDDELATSAWEQDLYRLTLGEGSEADFVTVEEAGSRLPGWRAADVRTVLLTRDIGTMLRLAESGSLEGVKVNVGGIHHAPGRTQVRPYLYLDDADRERLRRLGELAGEVTARDLPGSVGVSLESLLKA